ncbi:hypothetical protein, partial [Acidovorax sp. WCS2018Noco2-34]|uniref:hypothetical protein n=1 Tax=Acidovorax sp. WCS2018Noco2-34 TaxID=3073626 RepID=UPI0028830A30
MGSPIRAIASLGLERGAQRLRMGPSAAMARMGCWLFNSLLYAPRSAAGGVACVPQDTQASLSSLPQLFER